MNRQNLVLRPVETAVRTANLLEEILAMPPVASYGQGHVASHGNGLVQNNVTYMYGVNQDPQPAPEPQSFTPPGESGLHKAYYVAYIAMATICMSAFIGIIALIYAAYFAK
jgi:hypothetical protein